MPQAENFETGRRSATRYKLLSTYGAHAELYGSLHERLAAVAERDEAAKASGR